MYKVERVGEGAVKFDWSRPMIMFRVRTLLRQVVVGIRDDLQYTLKRR